MSEAISQRARKRAYMLRQRRLAAGLLIKTVAYSIGIDPSMLGKWEHAKCVPPRDWRQAWERFLTKHMREAA